jgi:hypothetical protein
MDEPQRSRGWTRFAMIAIGVAGLWNLALGITAFSKKGYFDQAAMLYRNLAFWGWIWLLVGLLQLVTVVLIARGTILGRGLGIAGASASMIVWFLSIGAHPISSILVVTLDLLIVWALTADQPDPEFAVPYERRDPSGSSSYPGHLG